MKKIARLVITGILCLLVMFIMLGFCLNQPYLYTGFRLSSSDFTVTELFKGSSAEYAGFTLGDRITRINDIDTADFAAQYYTGRRSVWYSTYQILFKKGELYRFELADGNVRYFRVPETLSLGSRIRFLSIDDKVGFSVGIMFIILGILLSMFIQDENDISPFILFLYSIGVCLANAYSDSHNTLNYSICNLVLFQLASAGLAASMFRIIAFFCRLAGKEKSRTLYNYLSIIPYALTAIRFIAALLNPLSFFDGPLFYMTYLNLAVPLYAIVMFFVLIHYISPQSSLTLRFLLLGICIGLTPAIVTLVVRLFTARLPFAYAGESLKTFLPLLFIPVCLLCSFIQTKKARLDVVVSRVIVIGCSALFMLILSYLPFDSNVYRCVVLLVAPFMCVVLEKPVTDFLYPKVNTAADSFSDLEKFLFACDNERDMFAVVTDWLQTVLNPSFIVFYEIPDESKGTPGRTIYQRCENEAAAQACVVSLIASRCAAGEDDPNREEILVHDNWGISAPVYKAHHVFGYVFIGVRSRYEMFSNSEIRLLQPTARILMEALLVLDLKQQVEYINNMQNRIVYSFADMIESRDGTTGQHVKRTSLVVDMLARFLKKNGVYDDILKPDDYAIIPLAAPLHDIGKIKVPDRILSKPGKLTDEEFAIIKTHPVVGEKIINKTMFKIEDEHYLKTAREMALYHHEKWDGSGYPEGLKGTDIPVSARIMAVADVFDALCSARSYKKAYTIDEAFEIIDNSKGTHFEPVLVDAMHTLRSDLTKIYSTPD